MAIQKKSKSKTDEKAAEAFIRGSDATEQAAPTPTKSTKTPVALRFDSSMLAKIDAAAKRKGISRNAWISFHCAEALENE